MTQPPSAIHTVENPASEADGERPAFNLLRWYAVVSLPVIFGVAVGLGVVSSLSLIHI